MSTTNLKNNPAFNEVIQQALADYKLWFTDNSDKATKILIKNIDQSLASGDYWNCDYLDDALAAWSDNLVGDIGSQTNPDNIVEDQEQIKLIDQYFNQ